MFISCIGVDIKHPSDDESIDADAQQVLFPNEWLVWGAALEKSIKDWGEIRMAIGTTAGPNTAIIFGHCDTDDVTSAIAYGQVFGFIVDPSTLKQLRKALDAAIAATEK